MKAIQVMFDETLLARLDASEEVRREGRSAVLSGPWPSFCSADSGR